MPIDADTVSAIRALADRADQADAVPPFSEATRLALPHAVADPTVNQTIDRTPIAHLSFDPSERLLAAGIVLPDGSTEVVVDPEHRRKGLGSELLARVFDQRPDAHVWAHGDLPGSEALATAAGLRRIRTLLKLARPVDGQPTISDPDVPQGFSLTTFDVDRDAQDWLDLNKIAFDYHPEQGRMTMADLQERIAEPWFDASGLLLLRDADGRLAASHWTKIDPAEPDEGEVYVVAVDPTYQGHGLGRFITAAGLAHLRDKGVHTISLYVEGDNEPALATYRGLGFTPAAVDGQYAR